MRKIIGAIILGIMMSTFAYAQESAEQEPPLKLNNVSELKTGCRRRSGPTE